MPHVPSKVISFVTSEGTFMNVDVSPSGVALAFDLLGDIYELSINGGRAIALTTGRAWDTAPKYSLDGNFLYFISDKEGIKNIWRLTRSDGSLMRVTASEVNFEGSLNWGLEGDQLLAARTFGNVEVILHLVDPHTGDMQPIDAPTGAWINRTTRQIHRRPIKRYSAVQSSADRAIYYTQAQYDYGLERLTTRLHIFDPASATRNSITPPNAPYNDYMPQLSRNGQWLTFFRQYKDRRTELRIRNVITGQGRTVWELGKAEDATYGASHDTRPNYAFTPDDRHIILWHAGKIHRVARTDGTVDIIPFQTEISREVWKKTQPSPQLESDVGMAKIIRWPIVSRDGRTIVFTAIGYVWVMDLDEGDVYRLTKSSDFEFMPALSPDGKSVAYISFTASEADYWPGRLMIADLHSRASRLILENIDETFLLPSWSQDGDRIALIRETRTEKGITAAFGWTKVSQGIFHEVTLAPSSKDYFNKAIYARSVSFDDSGQNLLVSFQTSRSETTVDNDAKTILAIATLDGSTARTLAVGAPEVVGVTPSPDLRRLALTKYDESIWLVNFEPSVQQPLEISANAPDARRVSDNGGYYLAWNNSDVLTFGFGEKIYLYCPGTDERQELAVGVTFSKPKAEQPIAFIGARLITVAGDSGAGPIIESGTLLVNRRRIVAIGPASSVTIPTDALTISVVGKTIMPGLLDVHYHNVGGGGMSALGLPNANFHDKSSIMYGVTSAWDPDASLALNDGAPATVELQRSGRILGPRWSHAAQGRLGRPWDQLQTYAYALAAVERHAGLGVNLLKEAGTPNRKHRQWLSAAAHSEGLGIVSHLDNFEDMLTGIIDGFTGGDHSYIPIPFFKDVTEMLRQSGYIWTPQLMITNGSITALGGRGGYNDARMYYWQEVIRSRKLDINKLALTNPALLDVIRNQSAHEGVEVPYSNHRVGLLASAVATAAKSGVYVGVSAHDKPALLLHGELFHLWKGGLSVQDVVRAATIGNAAKLGLQEEIGSLEVGKIADFLILDENPLDDILNSLSVRYTVQGGVIYESATAKRINQKGSRFFGHDVADL